MSQIGQTSCPIYAPKMEISTGCRIHYTFWRQLYQDACMLSKNWLLNAKFQHHPIILESAINHNYSFNHV